MYGLRYAQLIRMENPDKNCGKPQLNIDHENSIHYLIRMKFQ